MKTNIDINSVLVVSQNQVSADLSSDADGSVVILNLKDGVYYELKEVGMRVWNLIQQPHSIQLIKNILLEEYEVDAEQCEADLLALTEHLAKLDLIQVK
ncbi:MAG: PqqD family protein [bacterium]|nr:PqqD family protein [bacterium]